MAYRRFDDAPLSAEDAPDKLYNAFPMEAIRRAIQSISNRIVAGTGSTSGGGTSLGMNLGTGSTAGLQLNNDVTLVINGRMGTATAQNNIFLPAGTQSSNTWVKYLVAAKFGTGATVVAGNEGASSTAARLPNCPDGYVAVGYCEYNTTSGKYIRFGGGTAGGNNVLSGNTAATCGTVVVMQNLMHMPLNES